jgi:hypothetical protein
MKKIFLGMLAIALMASPAVNASGGKKKAKKKARIECKQDNCCDPKNCTKDCSKDIICPPVCAMTK